MTTWEYDDGGRSRSGFKGDAGDCVTRALAIATGLSYAGVYRDLAEGMAQLGKPRSARNGISRKVYEPWLFDRGWLWVATMGIGTGCTLHLDPAELPNSTRIIARLSRHMCAVVDGTIRDTHDPSRGGTRCVYGYFEPGVPTGDNNE